MGTSLSRSEIAFQRAPRPDILSQLSGIDVEGPFFRVHQERPDEDRGCWWFAGTEECAVPGGRFDLLLPRGTLYLAETPLAAALEFCGRYLAHGLPIPVTAVAGRIVSQVHGKLTHLGDLTHKEAPKVGVTREIYSLGNYEITTSWAIGLAHLKYRGLEYYPRFSTDNAAAYAVFGQAGRHKPAELTLVSVETLGKVLHAEGSTPRQLPSQQDAVDDTAEVESR